MALTPDQRRQLHTALLDAFDAESLEQLTALHLGVQLRHVTKPGRFSAVALDLITWAEQQGRVRDLMTAMLCDAPSNELVTQTARDYGIASPAPIPPACKLGNGRKHVNRQDELAALDRLRQSEVEKQIILMRAGPGFGKTLLLEEYANHLRRESVAHAHVELQPGFTPLDLMSSLASALGRRSFADYQAAINMPSSAQSSVQIRNVAQLFGSPRIDIKEATSQIPLERLQHISNCWFSDLGTISGEALVILIVDQYNLTGDKPTVGPDLQTWMQAFFLPEVCRLPRLRVIVAGQHTPDAASPWKRSCSQVELKPIDDPYAWMDLVHSLHGAVTLEQVRAFCVAMRGHPLNIATHLTLLCTEWPRGD